MLAGAVSAVWAAALSFIAASFSTLKVENSPIQILHCLIEMRAIVAHGVERVQPAKVQEL